MSLDGKPQLGKVVNVGNSCWLSTTLLLLARCSGFDAVEVGMHPMGALVIEAITEIRAGKMLESTMVKEVQPSTDP